ncbi:aminotransferase class V-fold PLP-dependent enzyme [Sphingomonas ginkgonis]|uniref:Aminotransferase class V-fold PLP-dependent enzyme n=1 Tax=Sphingomonas ginkgonis TaxID=2315330 RepID=A0A3R9Z5Q7_9SPHN|nr:aminotransferase class V-fold PLP-dependent enzyme [Sphingomonas ginkgonis]RST30367.1 aminotransferase class V-fold PLP-dependent enzyme [Sphingomonas ginkgonis]
MSDLLLTRLAELERAAAPLEPAAEERQSVATRALGDALNYWAGVEEAPASVPAEKVFERRFEPEFTETGRAADEVLDYVRDCIAAPGFTTASPRFMAYVPGGGLPWAAVGDLLAAASNKYSGFASAGPGAVRVENACVRWVAEVVGLPDGAGGTLTSGGSLANLTAIVAAREARDPNGGGAVYHSRFVHHCVDKALRIADRHRSPRRLVATDAEHRLSVAALRDMVEQDLADGIRPWLVVASAGTVDTGAIDPLDAIADLCAEHGIWLHVDGAYGGLFALSETGRGRLTGIDRADSLALDPHKTMFLPYGTGAVLVRDERHLLAAFSQQADYLVPVEESAVGHSPADLSGELTRHFRALRLWLPLQLAGVGAFRAAQEEKLLLAAYFHRRLAAIDGFEPGPEPQLSTVAFRLSAGDAASERLLGALQQGGRVMLSGTRVDGRFTIRCCILSFRTHRRHVDELLALLSVVDPQTGEMRH